MSTSEGSLEGSIRVLALEGRRRLEDHPAPEELLDYHAGRTSDAGRERVQDHLALCSDCAKAVLDMETFPDLEPAEGRRPLTGRQVAAEWRAMEERLLHEDAPVRSAPARVPMLSVPRRSYALAAALAAACLGVLLWNVSLRQTARRLSEPRANVPALSVTALNAPGERGGDAGAATRVRGDRASFLFLPFIATDPSSTLLDLELRDQAGDLVWSRGGLESDPARGLNLMLPADFLSPGSYRIELYRPEDRDRKPVTEYLFFVE